MLSLLWGKKIKKVSVSSACYRQPHTEFTSTLQASKRHSEQWWPKLTKTTRILNKYKLHLWRLLNTQFCAVSFLVLKTTAVALLVKDPSSPVTQVSTSLGGVGGEGRVGGGGEILLIVPANKAFTTKDNPSVFEFTEHFCFCLFLNFWVDFHRGTTVS